MADIVDKLALSSKITKICNGYACVHKIVFKRSNLIHHQSDPPHNEHYQQGHAVEQSYPNSKGKATPSHLNTIPKWDHLLILI